MDIGIIENKLNLKYFENLKEEMIKNNINTYDIDLKIETIINFLNNNEKNKLNNSSSETENFKQIFSDENLYKKPWNKLNLIHKQLKIKEFIRELKIESNIDRDNLKDELINLVKSKIFNKKLTIIYDENKGKIKEIPKLEHKNGKYYYKIE